MALLYFFIIYYIFVRIHYRWVIPVHFIHLAAWYNNYRYFQYYSDQVYGQLAATGD